MERKIKNLLLFAPIAIIGLVAVLVLYVAGLREVKSQRLKAAVISRNGDEESKMYQLHYHTCWG